MFYIIFSTKEAMLLCPAKKLKPIIILQMKKKKIKSAESCHVLSEGQNYFTSSSIPGIYTLK